MPIVFHDGIMPTLTEVRSMAMKLPKTQTDERMRIEFHPLVSEDWDEIMAHYEK